MNGACGGDVGVSEWTVDAARRRGGSRGGQRRHGTHSPCCRTKSSSSEGLGYSQHEKLEK